MKIIILMKKILILLFMSLFWLAVVNLKNAKHFKKDKIKNECLYLAILKDNGIFACQKMRKKKQTQILLRSVKNAFNAYQQYKIWALQHNLLDKDLIQFKNFSEFCPFCLFDFLGAKFSNTPRVKGVDTCRPIYFKYYFQDTKNDTRRLDTVTSCYYHVTYAFQRQ